MDIKPKDIDRFWAKVDRATDPDGCWLWTASCFTNGYGAFRFRSRQLRAHRFAYRAFIGSLADDEVVCHHCDTKVCVRPDHLFAGTHADNHADREAKSRGKRLHGEANPRAKITAGDVRVIRAACSAGTSQQSIADQFGITQTMVSRIMRGIARKHVA